MIDTIIDISHHQHKPDFVRAKASGITHVIHKATQGTTYTDPTFSKRKRFIEDAGLQLGAYHFLTPEHPVQQALSFLSVTMDVPVLVVDWETSKGRMARVDDLNAFIEVVIKERPSLGLYLGQYDLTSKAEALDYACKNTWLWIARYGKLPEVPLNTWNNWTMWQWTDGAVNHPQPVSGIGYCDRDKFNGDATSLQKLWEV